MTEYKDFETVTISFERYEELVNTSQKRFHQEVIDRLYAAKIKELGYVVVYSTYDSVLPKIMKKKDWEKTPEGKAQKAQEKKWEREKAKLKKK